MSKNWLYFLMSTFFCICSNAENKIFVLIVDENQTQFNKQSEYNEVERKLIKFTEDTLLVANCHSILIEKDSTFSSDNKSIRLQGSAYCPGEGNVIVKVRPDFYTNEVGIQLRTSKPSEIALREKGTPAKLTVPNIDSSISWSSYEQYTQEGRIRRGGAR